MNLPGKHENPARPPLGRSLEKDIRNWNKQWNTVREKFAVVPTADARNDLRPVIEELA